MCIYVWIYKYIHTYIYLSIQRSARGDVWMCTLICVYIYVYMYGYIHTYKHTYICQFRRAPEEMCVDIRMGWLRLVGPFKSHVSFAKEPYKRDLYSAKETYNLEEPANHSHPICGFMYIHVYMCMNIQIYVTTNSEPRQRRCVWKCVCSYVYIHVYIFMDIYTYARTFIPVKPEPRQRWYIWMRVWGGYGQ